MAATGRKFPYVYGKEVSREYPDVEVSIELITPDIADEMLKCNINNRKRARSSAARAIMNGEWELNGATIVFCEDGTLLDGQHRLTAVVETGEPIVSIVVRGLPKKTQISMDTGKTRSAADFLHMMGYKNAKILASAAGALLRIENGGGIEAMFMAHNRADRTTRETVEYAVTHDDEIQPYIHLACRVRNKYKGVETATVIASIFEFKKYGASEDDIKLFFDQLLEVEIPTRPTMLLKKKLSENAENRTGRLPQRIICAYIIKSWNAYMLGDEPKLLKFAQGGANPETFPMVYTKW